MPTGIQVPGDIQNGRSIVHKMDDDFEASRDAVFKQISQLAQFDGIGSNEQEALVQITANLLHDVKTLTNLKPYLLVLDRKSVCNVLLGVFLGEWEFQLLAIMDCLLVFDCGDHRAAEDLDIFTRMHRNCKVRHQAACCIWSTSFV